MIQELIISGQLMDLDQNTDVVLDFKSNIFGDISKIEGSHSYTIQLPKTRQNMRVLKDPGNPARRSESVRRYLEAKYYRNGIDIFGECRAVVLGVTDSAIQIALTMQGLKSLATWTESGSSIKDLFNDGAGIEWNSVSAYDSMLNAGRGIARMDVGANMATVTDVYYPPAVSLEALFAKIMAATGVQDYTIPTSVEEDMKTLFIPFIDYIGTRYNRRNYAHTVATGLKREPAREAVHLAFSNFDINPDPQGWDEVAEAFRVPDGSDTFIMGLFTLMPAGTFKTTGASYFRIMGSAEGRDVELFTQGISVYPDGSALLSYDGIRTLNVSGYSKIWVEVSNVEEGVHVSTYENSYPFLFQGQRAVKAEDLLIGRNLPDIKQIDLLKFICHFYGLAILPYGVDGLNFVPYAVLEENKESAVDWSDKLLGGSAEEQRGEVEFVLSDFAQRNIFQWTEEDNLEYRPADGVLVVDDSTIQEDRVIATLPFSASYQDKYPIFEVSYNDDGTHEVTVNGVKPRIFRLIDNGGSAALYFTGELNLPSRVQEYYREYQDIIRNPIAQKVECRLTERDLKELDFSVPVYFSQFGHFYALESVRTSSKSDVCEIRMIQI